MGKVKERKGTNLLEFIFFLVAFFHRAEHPFRYRLVADTEFDGSVQDGSTENCVGIPSPGSRTGHTSIHERRRGEDIPEVGDALKDDGGK